MRKVDTSPIAAADLAKFVADNSDFGFEMQVLSRLNAIGFACSHSGTYRDPITDKIRQFDIRALMDRGQYTLALAVECKNLRSSSPLLLSAVPRIESEAFHDLLDLQLQSVLPNCRVFPVAGLKSPYKLGEMVCKKTDQVAKDGNGNLISNDEATFDKLNQSISSSYELVSQMAVRTLSPFRRAVVPVLVVPSGLLWQVDYDRDGQMIAPPRQVDRATLFLNNKWDVLGPSRSTVSYRLSHLEVVTFEELRNVTEYWIGPNGFFSIWQANDQ